MPFNSILCEFLEALRIFSFVIKSFMHNMMSLLGLSGGGLGRRALCILSHMKEDGGVSRRRD